MFSVLMSAVYIQVHIRLDFVIEANTISPDHDLGPYCLQFWLPKNVSRRDKVLTGGLSLKMPIISAAGKAFTIIFNIFVVKYLLIFQMYCLLAEGSYTQSSHLVTLVYIFYKAPVTLLHSSII